MINHLLQTCIAAVVFTTLSYQPVEASDKAFTAKPVMLGDNLISILRQQGFSEREREQILAADKGLRELFLTLDTRYLVRRSPNQIELQIFDSQTSEAFFIQKKGSQIQASSHNPRYEIKHTTVEGRVFGSLMGSILGKIKSNWVATRFTDAYVFDLESPRDVARGARFNITVEKKYVDGQFIKYGEVLETSLEIAGMPVKKKFVRYRNGGVFFAASDLLENRPFYAPVEYIKVASPFKPKRFHPITRRLQPHLGIDFELPEGEAIFAPRSGTVIRYGRNRAAGNYIVLLHANGIETSYNHLSKIDKRIRQGLRVSTGEKIGEVGCTGYCTRAHLHFAVKKNGRMVNPVKYLKSYPSQMESMLEEKVARN